MFLIFLLSHRCFTNYGCLYTCNFLLPLYFRRVKSGRHWQHSWIQHSRLCWTGNKSAANLKVQQSWTLNLVHFAADLLPFQQSRLCWIQLCCQCLLGIKRLIISMAIISQLKNNRAFNVGILLFVRTTLCLKKRTAVAFSNKITPISLLIINDVWYKQ